jgi:hypothetical protein
MQPEPGRRRALTSGERALAVAMGIVMLFMSVLSIVVTVAIVSPLGRLVEGLSK